MPVCVFIIAIFIDEEMKEVCVITPKVTQPVRNSTWIQIGPFFCFFFCSVLSVSVYLSCFHCLKC